MLAGYIERKMRERLAPRLLPDKDGEARESAAAKLVLHRKPGKRYRRKDGCDSAELSISASILRCICPSLGPNQKPIDHSSRMLGRLKFNGGTETLDDRLIP